MLSSLEQMRHSQIWDLLEEYADIRDQLEDLFDSLRLLQQCMEMELEDLSCDFEELQERLNNTSKRLYRFKTAPDPARARHFLRPAKNTDPSEQEDLPFRPQEGEEAPYPWGPDDTGMKER